mmetsp:Transcript_4431/g.10818  ORF Transcript_4431/g.10818 Transcript_4431/m.10818 type:complete len:266 (-) Transcript_4431:803-1600(-)
MRAFCTQYMHAFWKSWKASRTSWSLLNRPGTRFRAWQPKSCWTPTCSRYSRCQVIASIPACFMNSCPSPGHFATSLMLSSLIRTSFTPVKNSRAFSRLKSPSVCSSPLAGANRRSSTGTSGGRDASIIALSTKASAIFFILRKAASTFSSISFASPPAPHAFCFLCGIMYTAFIPNSCSTPFDSRYSRCQRVYSSRPFTGGSFWKDSISLARLSAVFTSASRPSTISRSNAASTSPEAWSDPAGLYRRFFGSAEGVTACCCATSW